MGYPGNDPKNGPAAMRCPEGHPTVAESFDETCEILGPEGLRRLADEIESMDRQFNDAQPAPKQDVRPDNLRCEACGGPTSSDLAEADRTGMALCYDCEGGLH